MSMYLVFDKVYAVHIWYLSDEKNHKCQGLFYFAFSGDGAVLQLVHSVLSRLLLLHCLDLVKKCTVFTLIPPIQGVS